MAANPSRQRRFRLAATVDRQRQIIIWMINMIAAEEPKVQAVRDALERAKLGGVELCDRILAHYAAMREEEEEQEQQEGRAA